MALEEDLDLNWDLAEIACFAAKEIGDCCLDRGKKYKFIKKLSSSIKESFSDPERPDPVISNIFYEAFKKQAYKPMETIEDLYVKANSIMQKLEEVQKLDKKELKELRGFCLDLSWIAAAYLDYDADRFVA